MRKKQANLEKVAGLDGGKACSLDEISFSRRRQGDEAQISSRFSVRVS
ncbi:MAG: hypothetical protein PHY43_11075 [Verrucomicrobiales bacterium]|nr:hypothetical protein [Verrucomicrobiales bacterium]